MDEKLMELHKVMCKSIHCNYDEFQDAFAIDTLITAENLLANGVVIPVRCCDCKYGIWDDEEAMYKCVYSAEFYEGVSEWLGFCDYNDGNHFCSYGERKDNE